MTTTTSEPTTELAASKACGSTTIGRSDEDRLAAGFAALGETKRLGILVSLASGERCACDLVGCCGDRQPLLSFHLKRLREAGLVRARREGRWMHYSIDREALRELSEAALALAEGRVDPKAAECC